MVLYNCYSVFFFFKQKTAYEMRISDWSSDVCSSDLIARAAEHPHGLALVRRRRMAAQQDRRERGRQGEREDQRNDRRGRDRHREQIGRASCREGGVRTCRSRWSPYHYKKKNRKSTKR